MLERMGFGQSFFREMVVGDFSGASENKFTGGKQEIGI